MLRFSFVDTASSKSFLLRYTYKHISIQDKMRFREGRGGGSRFSITTIINLVLRFLQLIFALAVIGLYAQDLHKAHKEEKYTDGKWVRKKASNEILHTY